MSEAFDVSKIDEPRVIAPRSTEDASKIAEAVKALQWELAELRKIVRAGAPQPAAVPPKAS